MAAVLVLLRQQDERVFRWLVCARKEGTQTLMRAVTHSGDAVTTITLALALLIWADGTVGATAAFTLAFSHLLVQSLKRSVNRARPSMPAGVSRLIEPPDRFSFPSGHAAAGLSLALALSPAVTGLPQAAIWLVAGTTGASRCYLGVHYPGDVLAGWLLAAVAWWLAPHALVAFGVG